MRLWRWPCARQWSEPVDFRLLLSQPKSNWSLAVVEANNDSATQDMEAQCGAGDGTVIPFDNIIDKSEIIHSGLFSEINKHLSPCCIIDEILDESLITDWNVSSHEKDFFCLRDVKKISLLLLN